MTARRIYLTVGLCAVVVYLGALWNQFALDDLPIIVVNPLVTPSGRMAKPGSTLAPASLLSRRVRETTNVRRIRASRSPNHASLGEGNTR